MTIKYSIILPVYNEEETLPELYRRLKQVVDGLDGQTEMIFVNDGSQDGSFQTLGDLAKQDKRIKVLSFSRNFGHQMAITAGLDYSSGDACVVMDADLQNPPEVIPELISVWKQGEYEIIYASRDRREGENWFKKTTARLFYSLMQKLSKTNIPINAGDFRLLDRKVVDALCSLRECHRFVRGLIDWLGFAQTSVSYEGQARFAGETKYSLYKMVKFALDGITSFSYRPLQLATCLGFLFSIAGFFYAAYAISINLFTDKTVHGWTSLIVTVLLLGGIQLITLGIIGEYIGRIFDDVKQRPLYVVRKKIGFPEEENS